jgi:predicted HTH transcriptional regulator
LADPRRARPGDVLLDRRLLQPDPPPLHPRLPLTPSTTRPPARHDPHTNPVRDPGVTPPKPKLTVRDIVEAGESQTIEFKSTARYNLHTMTADPKLEHVIVKTVAGFLNAEGGILLIGVSDDGEVLGLDADFSTLGAKPNADGYELALRQLLESTLSAPTAATVRISFDESEGKTVCVVAVAAAGKPVFAKPPKSSGSDISEFWVRTGNLTKQLHGDDMVQYQADHWG